MQPIDKKKQIIEEISKNPQILDDLIYGNNEQFGLSDLADFLNSKTEEEQQESNEIQKHLNRHSEKGLESGGEQNPEEAAPLTNLEIFQKVMKSYCKKIDIDVVLKKKTDSKSILSMKMLSTDALFNYIDATQILSEKDTNVKRKDLAKLEALENFKTWYINRICTQFSLQPKDICNVRVDFESFARQNQIQVKWNSTKGQKIFEYQHSKREGKFKIKTHKLFDKIHISDDFFDARGNLNFTELKNQVCPEFVRGNWPYFQPNFGLRLGVNLEKMNYKRNEAWFGTQGNEGQWAVGFHGVRNPQENIQIPAQEGTRSRLLSILKENLHGGKRQWYQEKKAVNKDVDIGQGVYFTPHFEVALGYASPCMMDWKGDSFYSIILQCRLNPEAIRVCPQQEYNWVVKDPKDIRIYGILLINQDQSSKIDLKVKNEFKYSNYKCQITGNWSDFNFTD